MKKLTEKQRSEIEYYKRIEQERARFKELLEKIACGHNLTSTELYQFNILLDGGYGQQKS